MAALKTEYDKPEFLKPGDTLYRKDYAESRVKYRVTMLPSKARNMLGEIRLVDGEDPARTSTAGFTFRLSDIGRTLFRTAEEAERKQETEGEE